MLFVLDVNNKLDKDDIVYQENLDRDDNCISFFVRD